MNYEKWAGVGDDADDADDATDSRFTACADILAPGATVLPADAMRAFMRSLCERFMAHLSVGDGLLTSSSILRQAFPDVVDLAREDLTSKIVTGRFVFPACLPKRWRGREVTRLAGQGAAAQCIGEILEELTLGVISREQLFAECGNEPGSPMHDKLSERLRLAPGHFLLVAQLATPDAAWIDTRQLAWAPPRPSLPGREDRYEPPPRRVCAGCQQREAYFGKFRACGRCKKQHYCSRECQVRAWRAGHKGECAPVV
jgi:hypothetical protein